MIPPSVSGSTSSAAERRVFELLSRTGLATDPSAVCYHSLNLSRHDYKLVGELDFVILSRQFLLVLEVKGGGISCTNGVWTYTDRHGTEHRRSEGPFQQARSGMYSLRGRLEEVLGRGAVRRMTVGYGVVFPDVDFDEQSVEWDRPMVLDAGAFRQARDLADPLDDLVEYWTLKMSEPAALSNSQLASAAQLMRPSFERLPSLRNRADDLDAAMERLTEEQYQQLDLINENSRILCSGGAGTGKTFLAVELARRESDSGRNVGFLTSTRLQQAFVRDRLGRNQVVVMTVSDLPSDRRYDVLIVDEGQDLVNLDDLSRMDGALRSGLEGGCWRVFLDSNKQSGLVGRFDPDALDLLKGCGATLARLTHNCRNTHEIVLQTKLLTAADLGTPSAGHGPPVKIEYFESDDEQLGLLDEELERLRDDGVRPGDITILSPRTLHDSCAGRSRPARRGRLAELVESSMSEWPCEQITFCTVGAFKGLENQFILVVDVDRLDDQERDVNLLYVAMSRARSGLWMAMSKDLESRAEAISRGNLSKVMEDVRRIKD